MAYPLPFKPAGLFALTPVTYLFPFGSSVNNVVTQLAFVTMRGWNAEDRVSPGDIDLAGAQFHDADARMRRRHDRRRRSDAQWPRACGGGLSVGAFRPLPDRPQRPPDRGHGAIFPYRPLI